MSNRFDVERDVPEAPSGIRQRDFTAGWRACEAENDRLFTELGRAVELAERCADAIERISPLLTSGTPGDIMRARVVIAGLDITGDVVELSPAESERAQEILDRRGITE